MAWTPLGCSGSGTARPRRQRGVPTAGRRAWGAGLSLRRGPDAGAVYCFFPSSISFPFRRGAEAPAVQAVTRGGPCTRPRFGATREPARGCSGTGRPGVPARPAPPGSRLRVGSGRPPTPRAVQPSGLALPPGVGRRPRGRGHHEKWVRGGAPEPVIHCGPPLPAPLLGHAWPASTSTKTKPLSLPGESGLQRPASLSVLRVSLPLSKGWDTQS